MKKGSKVINTICTITGILICIVLMPVLIMNVTLIIKGAVLDEVPSFAGIVPQIVLTGSMSPEIESGDLIFCKTADPGTIKAGDVISFYDPASESDTVVTHRVVSETVDENGQKAWITKGDNNNTADETPVPADRLIAVYNGARIPGAGNIALFMQTGKGIIMCVLIPLIILILYDFIRRKIYDRHMQQRTEELLAQLDSLKAEKQSEAQQDNTL